MAFRVSKGMGGGAGGGLHTGGLRFPARKLIEGEKGEKDTLFIWGVCDFMFGNQMRVTRVRSYTVYTLFSLHCFSVHHACCVLHVVVTNTLTHATH